MKKIEVTIKVSRKGFIIDNIKPAPPKNMLLIKDNTKNDPKN